MPIQLTIPRWSVLAVGLVIAIAALLGVSRDVRSELRGSPQTPEHDDGRSHDSQPDGHETDGHEAFLPSPSAAAGRQDR